MIHMITTLSLSSTFQIIPSSHQPIGPASQWLQDVSADPVTEPLQPLRLARLRRGPLGGCDGAIPGGMEDPAESEEEDELGHLGGDCGWAGKICEDHQLFEYRKTL